MWRSNVAQNKRQILHHTTTNNKIAKKKLFALVFILIKRIKIAQTGLKTLFFFRFFGLHSNLDVKKLQPKAIVYLLILGQNSQQAATALRIHQVRLLKRRPCDISQFKC